MILNGNSVAIADNAGVVDPLTGYIETAVTAYDQQIVNQNTTTPLFVFLAILLLANS